VLIMNPVSTLNSHRASQPCEEALRELLWIRPCNSSFAGCGGV
jgi:hypothetical protein